MTICHGAPRSMAWPRRYRKQNDSPYSSNRTDRGDTQRLKDEKANQKKINTIQPVLKVARSFNAFAGAFRRARS